MIFSFFIMTFNITQKNGIVISDTTFLFPAKYKPRELKFYARKIAAIGLHN